MKEQKEINKSAGWGRVTPAQRRLDDWAKAEPTLKESMTQKAAESITRATPMTS